MKNFAIEAIWDSGKNLYAGSFGVPQFNAVIAKNFKTKIAIDVNLEIHETITSSYNEAITANILGLVNPKDKIVFFEPFYNS